MTQNAIYGLPHFLRLGLQLVLQSCREFYTILKNSPTGISMHQLVKMDIVFTKFS